MSDPKFQINRPEIPDEELLKYKNFNDVLARSGAVSASAGVSAVKPWHFWAGGAAVVAAVVATVWILSGPGGEGSHGDDLTTFVAADRSSIQPPLEGVDVPFEFYTINAAEDQSITTPSGTVIQIPANSLVNADGAPVQGEAEIRYREFHDPADFFVSGIPMRYDSAGKTYHFESAGMFEMQGMQGHINLAIDPHNPVTVSFASRQPGNQFNIYKLDPATGEWAFIEKDVAGEIVAPDSSSFIPSPALMARIERDGPEQVLMELEKELEQLRNKPVASAQTADPTFIPAKDDPELYNIRLEVDSNEFPEIAVYRDVLFEISAENTDFSPELAEVDWDDVSLSYDGEKYHITFVDNITEYTFVTNPVLIGRDYDNAMKELEARREASAFTLQAKKDSIHQKELELHYTKKRLDNSRESANTRDERRQQSLAQGQEQTSIIKRVFTVTGFGIWNSDCPTNLPQGRMFAATFVDAIDTVYQLPTVYLVERKRNALYAIYPNQYGQFTYNPSSDNVLWGVDENNTLVMYSHEDFKKLNENWQDTDSLNVVLSPVKQEIKKTYQVRQLMDI